MGRVILASKPEPFPLWLKVFGALMFFVSIGTGIASLLGVELW
jgi:hypothetical protein